WSPWRTRPSTTMPRAWPGRWLRESCGNGRKPRSTPMGPRRPAERAAASLSTAVLGRSRRGPVANPGARRFQTAVQSWATTLWPAGCVTGWVNGTTVAVSRHREVARSSGADWYPVLARTAEGKPTESSRPVRLDQPAGLHPHRRTRALAPSSSPMQAKLATIPAKIRRTTPHPSELRWSSPEQQRQERATGDHQQRHPVPHRHDVTWDWLRGPAELVPWCVSPPYGDDDRRRQSHEGADQHP